MTSPAWQCRDRLLPLSVEPAIMGVLNVTPDSFSDGGRFDDRDRAVQRGLAMEEEGAAILDIGGESSRPGADPVPLEEELRRTVPVVRELARRTHCLISIDTAKAEVARQALDAGAHIVNDITALRGDRGMVEIAAQAGAGVVLMHMQGTPRTMQAAPHYDEVVGDVRSYLVERAGWAESRGIAHRCLALDPGFGFGKTVEHNLALLRGLPRLAETGYALAVGVSRKSFLGHLTGCPIEDRLAPSLAALVLAVRGGARILRVHDVKESCACARLLAKFSSPHGAP